jgi:phage-related protein
MLVLCVLISPLFPRFVDLILELIQAVCHVLIQAVCHVLIQAVCHVLIQAVCHVLYV